VAARGWPSHLVAASHLLAVAEMPDPGAPGV